MDYEAIDRDMSSWTVSCLHNGTRFYLTDEGFTTDRLARAARFRWEEGADARAEAERRDPDWEGFPWQPYRVAEAMALNASPFEQPAST